METVSFALDGANYEIDLNEGNASKLRDALATYVARGRRVSAGGQRRSRRQAPAVASAADIRDWAAVQGLDIPARGRIPASIREAYEAAN